MNFVITFVKVAVDPRSDSCTVTVIYFGSLIVYCIDLLDTVREKEGSRFTNRPTVLRHPAISIRLNRSPQERFLYAVHVHQCEIEKSELCLSKFNAFSFFPLNSLFV